MDRNVMEAIADPLIHLVRNAVDHGLEPDAERVKSGKEAAGNIHLAARYVGSEIWVSVKDDGRGLQRERIIAKAKEKGLLKDRADDWPDKKVWDFDSFRIFHRRQGDQYFRPRRGHGRGQ